MVSSNRNNLYVCVKNIIYYAFENLTNNNAHTYHN